MKISIDLKKILFLLGTTFIFILFFYKRDMTPGNELKYMSIVDNALKNGDYFVFYNQGVAYADKPPFYFWVIMLVKKTFGYYSEVGIGLFSIIPAIVGCYSMEKITENDLSKKERLLAIGMLLSTIMFIGTSLTLRMDMLMTAFIVLSLQCFYKIYKEKNNWYHVYLMYLYIFLGVFTKGPVGIIFPIATIILFLFREKRLRFLKKLKLLQGLGILLILFSMWFINIYLEGGSSYLYDLTINQTIGRAKNSFSHVEPIYFYFEKIWLDFFPWSLLFISSFIISFKNKLESTSTEKLLSSAIMSHFVIMSLVSGKLEIYLIPIYPFIAFYTVIILKKIKDDRIWQGSLFLFSLMISLLFPSFIVAYRFIIIPFTVTLGFYFGLFITSILGAISLRGIVKKDLYRSCWGLILAMLVLLFTLTFKISELNKDIGLKVLASKGEKVLENKEIKKYYSFNFRYASSMDIYLGEDIKDLKDTEKLKDIISKEKIVLFIRKKDIDKNKELSMILNKMNFIWNSNKYCIYTNNKELN